MRRLRLEVVGCVFALVSACGSDELGSEEGAARTELSAKLESLGDSTVDGEVKFRSTGGGKVEMTLHLSECKDRRDLAFAVLDGSSCATKEARGYTMGDSGQHFKSVDCHGAPVDAKEERALEPYGWTLDDDKKTGLSGSVFVVEDVTDTMPGVILACGVLK